MEQYLASAFGLLMAALFIPMGIYGVLTGRVFNSDSWKVSWLTRREDGPFFWIVSMGYIAMGIFGLVMGIGFALHEPSTEPCPTICEDKK